MNIHEHQAKAVLEGLLGVPVPQGYPAFTVDEAVKRAERFDSTVWVVKRRSTPAAAARAAASRSPNRWPRCTRCPKPCWA